MPDPGTISWDPDRRTQQAMSNEAASQDMQMLQPLSPEQQQQAEMLQRLIHGNEHPAELAREHHVRNQHRLMQSGLAPDQNPGLSRQTQPGAIPLAQPGQGQPSPIPPGGPADVVPINVPNGMNGLQAPFAGGRSIQRANPQLSQPVASAAGPGAQQAPTPGPKTVGELDTLMKMAGLLMQARRVNEKEGDTDKVLAMKKYLGDQAEGGKNTRAAAGRTSREGIAAAAEEGKNARAGATLNDVSNYHRQVIGLGYAKLRQRMDEIEKRITAAKDTKTLTDLTSELATVGQQIKGDESTHAKMLSKQADMFTNPDEVDAIKAAADEAQGHAKDARENFARVQKLLDDKRAAGGSGTKSSTASSLKVKKGSASAQEEDDLATPDYGPGAGGQTGAQLINQGYEYVKGKGYRKKK